MQLLVTLKGFLGHGAMASFEDFDVDFCGCLIKVHFVKNVILRAGLWAKLI